MLRISSPRLHRMWNGTRRTQTPSVADPLQSTCACRSRTEAAYGSFLLAYAPEAARTDFSERVHPQALGLLAQEHPDYAGYLTGFAEHVRKELARVLSREGGTIRRSLFHSVKAWDQLKTSHGSDLCAWLEPLAAEDRTPRT